MKTYQYTGLFKIDVLIVGGAKESYRDNFISSHLSKPNISEYRFIGKFGRGGKYKVKRNRIEYYSEDVTEERECLKIIINSKLELLDGKFHI